MAVFGCIADDFTGASDAASFLVKGGMSVRLYNGIPTGSVFAEKEQAFVIALKSRTEKTELAVKESLEAARFLRHSGIKQMYFKYCSTFDSTSEGNIGPVADALMKLTQSRYTLLCPSLPANGRTVKNGKLMVNGVPLHESHMRNHPLTPMKDCRIKNLMEEQSQYPCFPIGLSEAEHFSIEQFPQTPFYLIPDYETQEDGRRIVEIFGELPLLTGGSGLLEPLANQWTQRLNEEKKAEVTGSDGWALILAGSCSEATLEQIRWYQKLGYPSFKMDPDKMMRGEQRLDEIWRLIEKNIPLKQAVLVYSSDTADKINEYQRMGKERVSELLESAIAELADRAVQSGCKRLVVAGGETSGAVTKKLGFSSYQIGESVAPGVPIMIPAEKENLRLVLKSGNFGQKDFFERALDMTKKENDNG